CDGVTGFRLVVPQVLDEETSKQLTALSLFPARNLRVNPVGLVPAAWDGEGRIEYLSTDRIALALEFDHIPDDFALALNDRTVPYLDISPMRNGEPLYLQLSELPLGLHRLQCSTRVTSTSAVESATLEILIRDPRPWTPAAMATGARGAAFRVECDPAQPSLE